MKRIIKQNNIVSMPLDRYEELLRKEFLANSILYNDYLTLDQVNWLKGNYAINTEISENMVK